MNNDEYRNLCEIYSDLKDEIQDNGTCQIVSSKKLTEIVQKLLIFINKNSPSYLREGDHFSVKITR
jgi:hypothetical protein